MPRRCLFGPVSRVYADENLMEQRHAGDCITANIARRARCLRESSPRNHGDCRRESGAEPRGYFGKGATWPRRNRRCTRRWRSRPSMQRLARTLTSCCGRRSARSRRRPRPETSQCRRPTILLTIARLAESNARSKAFGGRRPRLGGGRKRYASCWRLRQTMRRRGRPPGHAAAPASGVDGLVDHLGHRSQNICAKHQTGLPRPRASVGKSLVFCRAVTLIGGWREQQREAGSREAAI
jgi:hypothetical protein